MQRSPLTNQQILEKAIRKAIDNGLSMKGYVPFYMFNGGNLDLGEIERHYADLIFRHDFAKSLFGESLLVDVEIHTSPFAEEGDLPDVIRTTEAWKLHLKNMVIADDPIAYLGEHLDG